LREYVLQLLDDLYGSPEFYQTQCPKSYFTLGAQVNSDSVLLTDLFDGTGRVQSAADAAYIKLNVPTAKALWDQKLPVLTDPQQGGLIAFTRACIDIPSQKFTIVLLRADDASGLSFTEVAPLPFTGQTYYGPLSSVYTV
jgi:hypothetical protein